MHLYFLKQSGFWSNVTILVILYTNLLVYVVYVLNYKFASSFAAFVSVFCVLFYYPKNLKSKRSYIECD